MTTKRALTLWEFCVWAYYRQRVHWHLRTELDRFLWEWADSGIDPDGPRPVVHHDAGMLHKLVRTLPGWAAERIVLAAAGGERPEPSDSAPQPHPQAYDRFAKGMEGDRYSWAEIEGHRVEYLIRAAAWESEIVPVFARKGRKRMVKVGTEVKSVPIEFCPLVWEPDPVMFTLSFQLAGQWWAAMKALERAVASVVFREVEIIPDPLLAEPPPWLQAADIGNSRVFDIAQAASVDADFTEPPRGQRAQLIRQVDEAGNEHQVVRIRRGSSRLSATRA